MMHILCENKVQFRELYVEEILFHEYFKLVRTNFKYVGCGSIRKN